jgi:hypothetical protein
MKFFRHKPKPRSFWVLGEPAPLPVCPVHGDRCGQVFFDGKWFSTYQPCEALEGAIRRAEFAATHQAVFNPKTNDFDIVPR